MKFIIFLTCLVAVAYSMPQQESAHQVNEEHLPLLPEPQIDVDDDGHFVLKLVDEDGTTYEEEGVVLTNEKTGEEVVIAKKGTYSYPDENGKLVRLAYDVDEPPTDVDIQ